MNKEPHAFDAKDSNKNNVPMWKKVVAGLSGAAFLTTGITYSTDALKSPDTPAYTTTVSEELVPLVDTSLEINKDTEDQMLEDQILIENGTSLPDTVTLTDFQITTNLINDSLQVAEILNEQPLTNRQEAGITLSSNGITDRRHEAGESAVVQSGDVYTVARFEQYAEGDTEPTYIVLNHTDIGQ